MDLDKNSSLPGLVNSVLIALPILSLPVLKINGSHWSEMAFAAIALTSVVVAMDWMTRRKGAPLWTNVYLLGVVFFVVVSVIFRKQHKKKSHPKDSPL